MNANVLRVVVPLEGSHFVHLASFCAGCLGFSILDVLFGAGLFALLILANEKALLGLAVDENVCFRIPTQIYSPSKNAGFCRCSFGGPGVLGSLL
jgi:hypothetical protein